MEPVFYNINEDAARQAKTMNSFSEYQHGSETGEYQESVRGVYALADCVKGMNPDCAEEALHLAERYSRKLAEWYNRHFSIEAQYPSIMISGAGNFSMRKKEKQNAARDKHMKEYESIKAIKTRLESLATKKAIIKSSDANATEKLEEKAAELKKAHEVMKKVNAFYRKHKTLENCPAINEEQRIKLTEKMGQQWHLADVPFASFSLSNNLQKIKAAETRLSGLKAAKEQGSLSKPTEIKGFSVEVKENTELMRLQLIFEEKPSEEVRAMLKAHGFRWSPKNSAWQRQLTNNARYSLNQIRKETA